MKKIIMTLLCLLAFDQITSQTPQPTPDGYYYADGVAQYWVTDSTSMNIIVANMENYWTIAGRLESIFSGPNDEVLADDEDDNIIVNSPWLPSVPKDALMASISVNAGDIAFSTYSKRLLDGSRIWLRNEVLVKFKPNMLLSQPALEDTILSGFSNLSVQYNLDNEYSIFSTNDEDVKAIANLLYDPDMVEYATPDFYSEGELHANDPLFNKQWGLRNLGQGGGYPSIDIKAPEAWVFLNKLHGTIGSAIKVAVIDDGVEWHEDLCTTSGDTRVLQGYTANGDGTGRPRPKGKHGQCCAGIIAASHNDKGIAGIAPNSQIVPIRIFKNKENVTFSNNRIAKAITKAWKDYGAQVLSCSWGLKSKHEKVRKAIKEATKNCIVVFSSGNNNGSVTYPANSDSSILVVGAMDNTGKRWRSSNYGEELDLVAPGDDGSIRTIDREGAYGYGGCDKYNLNFGKTSAACPHVAAVAALILSVNSELTPQQVRDIIESTARYLGGTKYQARPNGKWDSITHTGYGVVDAGAAVSKAIRETYYKNTAITGFKTIGLCVPSTYSYTGQLAPGTQMVWEVGPGLVITSGQGSRNLYVGVTSANSLNSYVRLHFKIGGITIHSVEKSLSISAANYPHLYTSDYTLTANTTWNSEKTLGVVVTVPYGKVLTITSTIYCMEDACIIVQPGGRLVVNGGKLTSSCYDKMWKGIQVWGNSNQQQSTAYQGKIELKNGAVIENAKNAVRLWKPDDWSKTGGIITCNNATFRNNNQAVEFMPYQNIYAGTGTVLNNVSSFTNTSFIIDEGFPTNTSFTSFYCHVTMWDVEGIKFTDCIFENSHRDKMLDLSSYNKAIHTADAGFTVTGCTFRGFRTAVDPTGTGAANKPFTITNSTFIENEKGVVCSSVNYGTVNKSTFQVGLTLTPDPNYSYVGIKMNKSTGYTIKENNISRYPDAGSIPLIGIEISSSGIADNMVYGNYITGLSAGIVTTGLNYNPESTSGLQLHCNRMSGNQQYDILISRLYAFTYGTEGIAPYQRQGASASPGNSFSTTSNGFYHLYNDSRSPVYYYYAGAPLTYNSGVTMRTPNQMSQCTLSAITPLASPQQPELEQEYEEQMERYNELSTAYRFLVDGGNTEQLIAQIQTTHSHNALMLRDKLLRVSPYLSEEALKETVTESVLTPSMMLAVCLANPEVAHKEEFLEFLEQQAEPMPEYMIAIIRNSEDRETARGTLEMNMAAAHANATFAANSILTTLLTDSIRNHDEIRYWMEKKADKHDYYDIVAGYMEECRYDEAAQKLEAFGQEPLFAGDAEYAEFKEYFYFRKSLHDAGRTIAELSDEEQSTLQDFAEQHQGRSAALAQNILCFFYKVCYDHHASIPDPNGLPLKSGRASAEIVPDAPEELLRVFPNPAVQHTTFEWSLPDAEDDGVLTIRDITGKVVCQQSLQSAKGQWLWDTRDVANGTYIYKVSFKNLAPVSGKIIVNK